MVFLKHIKNLLKERNSLIYSIDLYNFKIIINYLFMTLSLQPLIRSKKLITTLLFSYLTIQVFKVMTRWVVGINIKRKNQKKRRRLDDDNMP